MNAWLNAPIPRKQAIAGVLIGQLGTVAVYVAAALTLKEAQDHINDQAEQLKIFRESLDFLMDHADGATLSELNSNLDFWRVIREMPPREAPPTA